MRPGWGGAALRLIPAHAGKTSKPSLSCAGQKAHPRSRGENEIFVALLMGLMGSSPLTRGKLVGDRLASTVYRLIPAHAGKTGHPGAPLRHTTAHPRSRGENTS